MNVSSYEGYLGSYGLYLPKKDFEVLAPYIKRGDFVKIGKQELVFYHQKGIYHLPLEEATVIYLNVKTFFMKKSELVLLKRILEKQQLEKQIGLPLDKKARAIFEEMRGSRVNWHAVTSYLYSSCEILT